MKRYSLGSTPLVDTFINSFNKKFSPDYVIHPVSGITMDRNNHFTAVVEYFELDSREERFFSRAAEMCPASIALSNVLQLPLYFIFYIKGSTNFLIYNYNDNTHFTKSILDTPETHSEFAKWWMTLKGTIQTKKFYKKAEYSSWKINEVLDASGFKWGGDLDGILLDSNGNVQAIIEFRKSTYKTVAEYDPADYYFGTKYRKGDYLTWYPLTHLADEIRKKLILVTLSMKQENKCGIAIVEGSDRDGLHYANGVKPSQNVFDFDYAYEDIVTIINEFVASINESRKDDEQLVVEEPKEEIPAEEPVVIEEPVEEPIVDEEPAPVVETQPEETTEEKVEPKPKKRLSLWQRILKIFKK